MILGFVWQKYFYFVFVQESAKIAKWTEFTQSLLVIIGEAWTGAEIPGGASSLTNIENFVWILNFLNAFGNPVI